MDEILRLLKPLYLNSTEYASKDWRLRKDCTIEFPVQRKLCVHEIVADFDDITDSDKDIIMAWFRLKDFKHAVYNSGAGLHVHFFTNITSKFQKVGLLEIIEKKIGYKIDKNPTKSGHIRAEYSFHPIKKYQKTLIYTNLNVFFYQNQLDVQLTENLLKYEPKEVSMKQEIGTRRCMNYILSNCFANGRKRLMFAVVSHYKALKYSDDDIFTLTKNWCKRQPNFEISDSNIWSSVHTSNGLCKCSYRHQLLQELGHPIECGKPLVQEGNIENIDL